MWKCMQKVDWKNFIFDLQWNKNLLLVVAEPIASKNISNVDATPWRRFDVDKFSFDAICPLGLITSGNTFKKKKIEVN